MILLGLDLGSAKTGLCALDIPTAGSPSIIGAATLPVDPKNLRATVDSIAKAIETSGAERVVVEWNERPYTPKDATPAAAAAMAYARETMARLLERIEILCESIGKAVERIAVATWRARIGAWRRPKRGVTGLRASAWARLNPKRDTADRRVKGALEGLLGAAAGELRDVHQRDAAGAAWGVSRAPAPASTGTTRAPRVRTAEGAREKRERAPRKASRVDEACEAMRVHGRPIRLDVLAVRIAASGSACSDIMKRAEEKGRVVKVSTGVYALTGWRQPEVQDGQAA